MELEKGLPKGVRSVAHCGVPAASATYCLTPRNRVVGAHRSAGIGRLVERRQDLHHASRVAAEIVPFVGAFPRSRQALGRWMIWVRDADRRALDLRVAREVGADEPPIPWPPVFGVAGRMDADEPAAGSDVSFKRRFLARVED